MKALFTKNVVCLDKTTLLHKHCLQIFVVHYKWRNWERMSISSPLIWVLVKVL